MQQHRPVHVSRVRLISLWNGDPGGEGGGAASLLKLRAAPSGLHSARLGEPKLAICNILDELETTVFGFTVSPKM